MINKSRSIIMLFIFVLFSSCEKAFDCFTSTGKMITEERNLAPYYNINLANNVDLKINFGSVNSCTVSAGKNIIDDIKTEIINETLFITNENSCNWVRSFKNKYIVNITLDTLKQIDYSGVGDIDFENQFLMDSLRIEVYDGWGDINLNYSGNYLRFIHNIGGVHFNASGSADDFYMYLADNGQADGSHLITRINRVWSLSTGNCSINVTEKLNARLGYIGNVYYRGNPPIVESTIESTGKLIAE